MKVVIISNLYKPYVRGGAERVAELMARGLKERGREVVVISTQPEAGLKIEEVDGIKIYRFKPLNFFYYLDDYKHNVFIRLLWRIWDVFNKHGFVMVYRILKREKPDLVITHNLVGLGYLIPLAIKKLQLKHVHVIHDIQLVVPSGLLIKNHERSFSANGFLTKIYSYICRALFGSVDIIVSPSNWLLDYYTDNIFFSAAKKYVLRNPLDAGNDSRAAKQSKKNAFLYVGQIEKHKGVEWLVDFWQKNEIDSKLLIVGKGALDIAKNIHNKNIEYLGCAVGDEMRRIFESVDFLIVPSLCYENSPMVIPQSFGCATPVICADIGGAAELIEVGKSGFKFEAGNAEDLLRVLRAAQTMGDTTYAEISAHCLREAGKYTLAKYTEQLEQIINS